MPAADRVRERRRAAALARHYRDAEGLSIREISRRLGRAEATVKAYLYDPTGEKARAVKLRYQGVCRGCGGRTAARGGKSDASEYYKRCHPGAIGTRWTAASRVLDAMRAWLDRYGRLPSSSDWSRTHAVRRGPHALERLDKATGCPRASSATSSGKLEARTRGRPRRPMSPRERSPGRDTHGTADTGSPPGAQNAPVGEKSEGRTGDARCPGGPSHPRGRRRD